MYLNILTTVLQQAKDAIGASECSGNSLTCFIAKKSSYKPNKDVKIPFTAVTTQHMLLLCVNTSGDDLNSAFG